MYGNTMGTLNVYAASSTTNLGQAIWSLSGDQGNKWYRAEARLPDTTGIMVCFEGIVGPGYLSDIAIDDVKLETTCLPRGFCDFESDLCGWTQKSVSGSSGSFVRAKPTSQLISRAWPPPTGDHTYGSSNGTFLYFAVSSATTQQNVLQLVSPAMPATSTSSVCFHFWYINYGSQFSNLTIYLRPQAGNTTSMWSMDSDGDQTGFQEGQIAYYTSTSYEIIIELFTKGDARGYIILDDVSFLPSYCEAKPSIAVTGYVPTPPIASTTVLPPGYVPSPWDCNFEVKPVHIQTEYR
ncbi:MAM and LDL-receptor class A domain-containing protein 1-like [Pomacea canaliculata]|uniref:MAM and LDL-receptor class A domain-containing protein 1-like n=1 Tax=Pomacea canaliculata TaxID=400727 RepID=UPI000D72B5F1|nr:MAM and LDL-receptor class A domain-containing protein 1-like [Pomacea canaliculata]